MYNLGVVDSPEYFANGVLVHNCAFGPGCKHDDQVDGSSGAYNELAGRESRPFEAALVGERRGYSAGF